MQTLPEQRRDNTPPQNSKCCVKSVYLSRTWTLRTKAVFAFSEASPDLWELGPRPCLGLSSALLLPQHSASA